MMKAPKKFLVLIVTLALTVSLFASPVAAVSNCAAVVTASSLNVRSGAGAGYPILTTAPRGATLTIIGVATENESWFKVDYNGTVGYMDGTYIINANSSEAAAAIAAAAEEAAAAAAQPAAPVITEAPVATEAPAATQTPVEVTSTPDANDPAWLILYPTGDANATVHGNLVRFRSAPGGEILGNFSNGARIYVNATSGSWYEVHCNGTVGYVHSSYVILDNAPQPAAVEAAPTVVTVSEPEVAPVATATPVVAYNAASGQTIVNAAMQYVGVPYVYGGTSPEGFDCSGLCYYVYQQCGYSINRVAHSIYTSSGVSVPMDQLQPGDIVCFGNSGYVWHVGIYVGNNQFIHAPQTGSAVRVESLSGTYYNNFVCGKRIV